MSEPSYYVSHTELLVIGRYSKKSYNKHNKDNSIGYQVKFTAAGWPLVIGNRLCIARSWQKYLCKEHSPDASIEGLTADDLSPSS